MQIGFKGYIELLREESAKISSLVENRILRYRSQFKGWPYRTACMICYKNSECLYNQRQNLCPKELQFHSRGKCVKQHIIKNSKKNILYINNQKSKVNKLYQISSLNNKNLSTWQWLMSTEKLQISSTDTKCLKL